MPPFEKKYLWPGIDGLRSVAFLLVFLHHLGPVPANVDHPVMTMVINQFRAWGWLGVDFFFVISGFLITSLLLQENIDCGNIKLDLFYLRRICRICPPYFFLLFTAFIFIPLSHGGVWRHFGSYLHIFGWMFLASALFIGNLFQLIPLFCASFHEHMLTQYKEILAFCTKTAIDWSLVSHLIAPTWSLYVEEQFYLLFPWFLKQARSYKQRFVLVGIGIALSIALRTFIQVSFAKEGHTVWYVNTFSHLEPLMYGAAFAIANKRSALVADFCRNYGAIIFSLSLLTIIAVVMLVPDIGLNQLSITPAINCCALAFMGLLASACFYLPVQKLTSQSLLAGFGRKTYAMYLWHYGCLYLVSNWTAGQSDTLSTWLWRGVLALALTYLVALLSWVVIEAPFTRLKTKFQRIR